LELTGKVKKAADSLGSMEEEFGERKVEL